MKAIRAIIMDSFGSIVNSQEFISLNADSDAASWIAAQDIPDGGSSATQDFTEDYEIGISLKAQSWGAKVMAKIRNINAAKNMDEAALLALLADSDAANIERLLWGGALATAKALIQAYSGSAYDSNDKAALVAIIDQSGLV